VEKLEEMVEAHGGVLLAHTSLVVALMAVLREKGVMSRDDLNTVFFAAITGAENATAATPAESRQARRLLEEIAEETAGPRGS